MKTEEEFKGELSNLNILLDFHEKGTVSLTVIQKKKIFNKMEFLKEVLEIKE